MKYPIHNLLYPDAPVMFSPDINLPMTMANANAREERTATGVLPNPLSGRLMEMGVKHKDAGMVIQLGTVSVSYICTWKSRSTVYFRMGKVAHAQDPPRRTMFCV
jgi:hypothetical protein